VAHLPARRIPDSAHPVDNVAPERLRVIALDLLELADELVRALREAGSGWAPLFARRQMKRPVLSLRPLSLRDLSLGAAVGTAGERPVGHTGLMIPRAVCHGGGGSAPGNTRTNTSITPLMSSGTRFVAWEETATLLPSPEMSLA
jgi:hypothetical protein